VIRRMFGPACIYGQVIKARRKNRVVSIDRKLLIGSKEQLEDALYKSEDSDTLNTSFVERHNLTIRQGSSYLHRKTAAHARWPHRLQEHLELLRCHYNFIRPHMALQFGTIRRTPLRPSMSIDGLSTTISQHNIGSFLTSSGSAFYSGSKPENGLGNTVCILRE
jgi:hypothetical protein